MPCMSVSALPGVCPGFCVRLPCPVRPGVWAPGAPADSERTPGRMQRNSNFSWRSFKTDRQTRVAAVGTVTGAAPLPWAPPQACGSAPGGGQKGTQQRRERTDGGLEAALQGLLCLSSAPLPPTGLLSHSPTHLPSPTSHLQFLAPDQVLLGHLLRDKCSPLHPVFQRVFHTVKTCWMGTLAPPMALRAPCGEASGLRCRS